MYRCWIENEYSEKLELTHNTNYTLYQIDGLGPPNASINTTKIAGIDGARFNSAYTDPRNIVIYLTVEGDCETNRINLYRYAKSRRYIKFYYQNEHRDVFIEGYVENIQIEFFEMKETVQISIICPQPYFKAVQQIETEFAAVTGNFVFPFAYAADGAPFSVFDRSTMQSVFNNGDIENGAIIRIKAIGAASNPQIFNVSTNESFKLKVSLTEGDEICINTNVMYKGITLTHDGATSNLINAMVIGSKWFQLLPGDNIFSVDAEEHPENLFCSIVHIDQFEGV